MQVVSLGFASRVAGSLFSLLENGQSKRVRDIVEIVIYHSTGDSLRSGESYSRRPPVGIDDSIASKMPSIACNTKVSLNQEKRQ